jgi:cytochrome b561
MPTRYSLASIALHWTMAACIAAAWLLGQVLEDMPRGPDKAFLNGAHALIGIAVLALLLPRLLARLAGAVPPQAPGWQGRAAGAVHLLLYLLMLALPLIGIASAMSGRAPFPVLGLFALPPLLSGMGLHGVLEGAHAVLANLMLGAVALHVAATLWHAVFRRDGVAGRMIPGLSR